MNQMERINKLRSLLASVGGSVDSKKKLHKLVYLLQQAGEDFDQDFTFHYYGVFSPSIARDLDSAEEQELIIIDEPDAGDWGFQIANATEDDQVVPAALSGRKTGQILESLEEKEAQFLEVLSTIVYLSKNYYSGKELRSKLRELKPKLTKHFTSAYKFARTEFKVPV